MSDNRKEGFSYESPEKQKKNAAKLFIFEIVVLLIVILVIFTLLNFLGFISLSKITKGLGLMLPETVSNEVPDITNNQLKGRNNLTPTISLVKPELSVTSELQNSKLVLVDKKEMIKQLQIWGLYGYSYTDELAGSTNGLPLKSVKIILTPQEKKIFSVKDDKGIYVGSEYKFDSQTLILSIYLAPRILSDKTKANSTFNYQMLYSLLALAKNAKKVDVLNDVSQQTQRLIDSQRVSDSFFVRVE